jgi:transcriptional regulator with XRE-family HTH domain
MPQKSILAERLREKGIQGTTELAQAIGADLAQASRWLNGAGFSVETAKKIAEVIGVAWPTVFSWQDGNH